MKNNSYFLIMWVAVVSLGLINSKIAAQDNALDFGGSDGYVYCKDLFVSGSAPRTVEAWVYPHSFPTSSPFAGVFECGHGASGSGLINFGLRTGDENDEWRVELHDETIIYNTTGTLNTWNHFALVYDGTNVKLYHNGNLVINVARSINTIQSSFLFGRFASGFFDGKIDEVRFWNIARSQAQIQSAMYTELTGNEDGLLAEYRMNEGSGTTTHNSSTRSDLNSTYYSNYLNVEIRYGVTWGSGLTVSFVLPTVTTQAVTDITTATATGNGNVTNLGVPNLTQYGVCWSTTANPTISLSTRTEQGAKSVTGTFTSSITGLTPGTLYHVRAYATNGTGTAYGEDVQFTTSYILPTVTTQAVTAITTTTATGNGSITNLGVPNPTQYGVCWSTTANPTIANSKTQEGSISATGAFTSSITGLTPGTLYHVKAYATNNAGTSYGEDVQFTTGGSTRYVGSGQTFTTIASALSASLTGDHIYLVDNTFYEYNLVINKGVTIEGAGGVQKTIDAEFQGRVFIVTSEEPVTLKYLYLTNGRLSDANGAGIYITGSQVNIQNCTIRDNMIIQDGFNGAGIAVDGNSAVNITSSTISNNSSRGKGAGINMISSTSSLVMTDCEIMNNFSYSDGGGIYSDGTLNLTKCNIHNNTANNGGGGILQNNSNITLLNCTIANNTQTQDHYLGGGIYLNGGTGTITGTTISNNSSYGSGGGIFFTNGNHTLTNCTITGNTAPSMGSDVYQESGTLYLNNCTIKGDNVQTNGCYIHTGCTTTFRNSIFADNYSYDLLTYSATLLYNCIIEKEVAPYAVKSNCISTDPKLLPLALNNNPNGTYTCALGRTSPAVNAGTSENAPTTDQRGFTRIGNPDIGAYEYWCPAYPEEQSSSFTSSNITTTQATISWTNGNGEKRVVLVKEGSAVDVSPVDGTIYTANTTFGSGDQIGTGNYVIANTAANSITVTGLSTGATYYFAIFEFNSSTDPSYLIPGLTGNLTTLHLPTVTTQAVTDITTTTATGNGNVTNLGVPNPTQYGVCWSTTANPTINLETKTTHGAKAATGAFTSNITGLTASTTYYARAYATNSAGTAYGEDVQFTTLSPLPVELSSFTAATKNNKVTLNWKTETEVNNYGFEIERSEATDVKSQTWEKIGFVQGYGNSNSPKEYSFTDKPNGGTVFKYRLKQIDSGGQYEYLPEVEVNLEVPANLSVEQNFPNPFNPATKIEFSIPSDNLVQIKVYNVLGMEVVSLLNEHRQAGRHIIEFNASNLSSGIYFYKVVSGNHYEVKKMILLR